MIGVIVLVVLVIVLLIGMAIVFLGRIMRREGKPAKINYRGLYIFGLIMVPISVVMTVVFFIFQIPFWVVLPLLALSITYLAIGKMKSDKWYDK